MTLRLLLPPSVGVARARARAELLDQSLYAEAGEEVEVSVARDYAELTERGREVELVWAPPTICAELEPQAHALYKCVRFGNTTYRAAILTPRGHAKTLSDLEGKRFAFVDPLSLGGHVLAAALLREAGVTLGATSFVGSYPEVLRALLAGEVDAGALMVRDASAGALRDALAMHGGRRANDALEALDYTRDAPNDAIVLGSVLEPRRARRLAELVLERSGRAHAAFCLALEADGFERAKEGEYASLRPLLALASA